MSMLPYLIFIGYSHYWFMAEEKPNFTTIKCSIEEILSKEENFTKCLQQTPGLVEIAEISQKQKNVIPSELIKGRCSMRVNLEDCMEKSAKSLQHCIEPDLDRGVQVWKKIDKEVLDYLCKNNVEVPINIFEKTDQACWDDGISEALNSCGSKLGITASPYDIEQVTKSCNNIKEFSPCMMKALPKSCPPNIAKMAEPIFQIVTRNLCNAE